jgi:hypothetical protein
LCYTVRESSPRRRPATDRRAETISQADGYCARALPRWHTRFGQAVGEIGVPTIVEGLKSDPETRITKGGVYEWLRGHCPTTERAEALVRISEGKLTMEMIYSHKRELDQLRHTADSGGEPKP